jgi:hypothetical protein
MDNEWRIKQLEDKVDQLATLVDMLERRIFTLENPDSEIPPEWPGLVDPPEVPSNKCPKCAIEFSGAMGYVCSRTDCPFGVSNISISTSGG